MEEKNVVIEEQESASENLPIILEDAEFSIEEKEVSEQTKKAWNSVIGTVDMFRDSFKKEEDRKFFWENFEKLRQEISKEDIKKDELKELSKDLLEPIIVPLLRKATDSIITIFMKRKRR